MSKAVGMLTVRDFVIVELKEILFVCRIVCCGAPIFRHHRFIPCQCLGDIAEEFLVAIVV